MTIALTTINDELTDQWSKIIIICGLLLIFYTTLFPFDFVFKDAFSFQRLINNFNLNLIKPDILGDTLRNILLFVPVSAGLTGLLQTRRLGRVTRVVVVLTAGLGLSLTIEVLQGFLTTRDSSLVDILTNGVGTFLGFLFFRRVGASCLVYASALVEKSKAYLSLKTLTAGFLGYVTLVFLISILLQRSTHLSNWDPTFPLVLGNERTGNRPWQGYVTNIYIADKAASAEDVAAAYAAGGPGAAIEDSLIVAYEFTGEENCHHEMEYPLQLAWQSVPPCPQGIPDERGLLLTAHHWLETKAPADFVSNRLRETSQFTLSAAVATADIQQTGPARIISISNDPYQRNFTLGQEGSDLILRLRTPVTGENGMLPELIVTDFFVDTNLHHLIITYEGAVLRLYVDGLPRVPAFDLTPLGLFSYYLRPQYIWSIRLNAVTIGVYKILYYGLVFIPLGFLLGLITMSAMVSFVLRVLWAGGAILLPALTLEVILASESGRAVQPENVLLGMSITVAAALATMLGARPWRQGKTKNPG